MALHKDLTGADLHEPKGIEVAPAGSVYVADGAGSGAWSDQYTGNVILNEYWLNNSIADISTPSSKAFFYIPVQSELFELSAIINAAITTANAVLTIYVNGVLFPESLTVPFSGSSAGQTTVKNINTVNTIPAGSTVEVRSDGASDTVSSASLTLGLRAK